jgi:rod shape determining protein RodA
MGKFFRHTDWVTVLLISLLGVYGLFLMVTIDVSLFVQQAFFLVVSLVILILISHFDRLILAWFAPIAYVIGNALLAITLFAPEVRGARRWITIAGESLQPSELVKPLFMLAFAWFISKYSPRQAKNLPLHFTLFLIPFLLIFKQPDLGTGIVYFAVWFAMMLAGGLELKLVIGTVLSVFFFAPWAYGRLAPYQKDRLITFIDPALDPKGAGYNALQATIAVGSGQIFGKGLGFGTQSHLRFLPEYHTDFIYATLIEELGFAGGMILLSAYALLLWHLLTRVWKVTDNLIAFVFGMGLFSMLLTQVFINAGMNMGILPITGITLPFISYGGSSMLSFAVSFGMFRALLPQKGETRAVSIS